MSRAFSAMELAGRALLVGMLGSALTGCDQRDTQVIRVDIEGEGESMSLPELPPPFETEEIEAMVETFEWSTTEALTELDEDGRPALHYVLILIRDRQNLEELNLFEIHYDALPLFEVEHERWGEQSGKFTFPGSQYGDFAFALIPAEVYNLFRQEALDGEPIFDAILLQEVPVPEARMPGGSVDYDWLGAQGFVYGGTEAFAEEPAPDGEAEAESTSDALSHRSESYRGDASVGVYRAALGGRIARRIRRSVQRGINFVREVSSEVRQFFGRSRKFSLSLSVRNTDPDFDTRPDEVMRQAWLGDRSGEPIIPHGAEVRVASGLMVSLDRGRIDRNGFVRFDVPRAKRIRVHIRLKNKAADLIGLLWDKRITVFHGRTDRDDDVHIDAHVRESDMNVLAQLTSARDFIQERVHYESPRFLRARSPVFTRGMPTALVRTGRLADVVFPNAVAPCLGYFGFGTLSFGRGRGWSAAAGLASIFDEVDIVIPEDSARSRVTPTHEYGHYIMCTFLADHSRRAFGRMYGDVWGDSLLQQGPDDGAAGVLGEAWADFLASQTAGGYVYFEFTASQNQVGSSGSSYCRADASPLSAPCLEDNIGGDSQDFPLGRFTRDNQLEDRREERIARYATLLTDVFDGSGADFHNGGVWRFTLDPDDSDIIRDVDWMYGQHAQDERVVLGGPALHDIILNLARDADELNYRSFDRAMSKTMAAHDVSPESICELFALHEPSGMCGTHVQASGPVTPSAPFPFSGQSAHDVSGDLPRVALQWSDLSPAATGFTLQAQSVDDASFTFSQSIAYARSQSLTVTDLPFDRQLRFEARTQNGAGSDAAFSEPATLLLWTPPEPARGLTAAPLPGGATLSWDSMEATAIRIRMTAPDTRDVGTVAVSEGSSGWSLVGLAGNTDYSFELVSVNGAGELSSFPSAQVTVTTLDAPEVYVATFGDDDHPLAGSQAYPFASVHAALSATDPAQPLIVYLQAGTYAEPALTIQARTVTLIGGHDASWAQNPDLQTTLELDAASSASLVSVTTPRFNTSARSSRAGLLASDAVVGLEHLAIVTNTSRSFQCVTPVLSIRSDLRLNHVRADASGVGLCRIATQAREGTLMVHDSTLVAFEGALPTTNSEHAALLTSNLDEAILTDSDLLGIDASTSGQVLRSIRGTFGWSDEGTGTVRVSRSTLSGTYGVGVGVVDALNAGGVDLAAAGSVFIDNSVIRLPGGVQAGDALRIDGGASGTVQLYQSTVVTGRNFVPTTARADVPINTVRIEGSIQSLTLVNNLLAFADWMNERREPYANILHLDGLALTPLVSSSVVGNLFSYPPNYASSAQQGGGPLVLCKWEGVEFSRWANTEAAINDASNYTCQTGGSLSAQDNLALIHNPGTFPDSRVGVVLDAAGDVIQTGSPATSSGTQLLLQGGAPLSPPWPAGEIGSDRNGVLRPLPPSRPGVGAYVVP